jgi:hypothetical protein
VSGVGAAVAVVVLVAMLAGGAFLVRLLRRQNQQIGSGRGRDPFTIGEPWRHHIAAAQADLVIRQVSRAARLGGPSRLSSWVEPRGGKSDLTPSWRAPVQNRSCKQTSSLVCL